MISNRIKLLLNKKRLDYEKAKQENNLKRMNAINKKVKKLIKKHKIKLQPKQLEIF